MFLKFPFLIINFITTLVYITCILVPYLYRNTPVIFFIFMLVLWMISALIHIFIEKKFWNIRLSNIVIILIFWILIIFLYVLYQLPNFYLGNFLNLIIYYFPIFFLLFCLKFFRFNYMEYTINYFFIVFIFVVINNLQLLSVYPQGPKQLTGSYGDFLLLYKTNIINDIYMCSIVLIIIASLMFFSVCHTKTSRFFLISFIITTIVLVIKSAFFTAIITIGVALIIYYLLKSDKMNNSMIKLFILIVIILFVLLIKDPLFSYIKSNISNFTENYILIERVGIICDIFINFEVTGTLLSRLENYRISLHSFFNSPLFGIGFIVSDDINTSGIGMHSFIFDQLARFGIIPFLGEIFIYILLIRKLNRIFKVKKIKRIFYICYIIFTFYSFFNPSIYPQTGLILFYIIPLIGLYCQQKLLKEKEL